MIRGVSVVVVAGSRLPRESGDDPNLCCKLLGDSLYSPRERG